jgi:hypothetical protein
LEKSRAVALVTAHPRVQPILAGRTFTVREIGPKHTGSPPRNVGAGMILTLSSPASGTFDFFGPRSAGSQSERDAGGPLTEPYQIVTYRSAVTGLTEIYAEVDFTSGTVTKLSGHKFASAHTLSTTTSAPEGR